MQSSYDSFRNAPILAPYNPNAQDVFGQYVPQYDQDGRFWGFGLLPFVGGLLLGGVGGYAAGNNQGKCCGGGYPPAYPAPYPQPYPYPYPQPYPYPVPVAEPTPIQYTSNSNYYLQPVKQENITPHGYM